MTAPSDATDSSGSPTASAHTPGVPGFPFSAIVGSSDLGLALALSAVSPAIGGVLVRGEKGTAKTTMVRALTQVLPPISVVPDCRFSCDPAAPDPTCPDGPHPAPLGETRPARLVELPVGATEDRVIGSLDLRHALGSGQVAYEPGLLAAANRGILYVDEVNLLHDHLVDLLLDAVATGRSTVEREGVSVAHAARLVLIGTMNPEEGELRPQLLDRFGLTVEVAAPRDPHERAEVIRRRLAYEVDPEGFAARFADAESELGQRIVRAQQLLGQVRLSDAQVTTIARVCAGFEVDGMRADIVTARTALAHAAWDGRTAVTKADIRAAARLALPHRRRRNPFDAPGLDEDLLDRLLDAEPEPEPEPPTDPSTPAPSDDSTEPATDPAPPQAPDEPPRTDNTPTNNTPADSTPPDRTPSDQAPPAGPSAGSALEQVTSAGQAYRTRLFTAAGLGHGEAGRRSRALTSTGRTVGAAAYGESQGPLHVPATVRAAAPLQRARGRTAGRLALLPDDLRRARTEGRESNLILLAVDASGSMAARKRMAAVKTAVLSLLLDAYQRRDKVGLITFRRDGAQLVLPPTSSVDVAARRLDDLASGGRTPLAEGLLCAAETVRLERLRDPRRRPLLVVVTDGRATSGSDAVDRSRLAAAHLQRMGVASLVVDCETGRFSLGLARELGRHLGADYVPLGDVAADALVGAVRESAGRERSGRERSGRERVGRETPIPDRAARERKVA